MSRDVRVLHCTPEDVFEVLSDGWLYPSWVVGASRMREVDESWPMAGAELHHSFGTWPVLIDDKTVVEEFVPGRSMVMRARGWPIGEARVAIDVKERGEGCVVRIQEEAIAGPGRFVPPQLLDIPLHWRNAETLHRLAYLAEGRATIRAQATTADKEMDMSGEQNNNTARTRTDVAVEAAGDAPSVGVASAEWADTAASVDAVESDTPGVEDVAVTGDSENESGEPATAAGHTGVSAGDEQADEAGGSTGAIAAEDAWNPMAGGDEASEEPKDSPGGARGAGSPTP